MTNAEYFKIINDTKIGLQNWFLSLLKNKKNIIKGEQFIHDGQIFTLRDFKVDIIKDLVIFYWGIQNLQREPAMLFDTSVKETLTIAEFYDRIVKGGK